MIKAPPSGGAVFLTACRRVGRRENAEGAGCRGAGCCRSGSMPASDLAARMLGAGADWWRDGSMPDCRGDEACLFPSGGDAIRANVPFSGFVPPAGAMRDRETGSDGVAGRAFPAKITRSDSSFPLVETCACQYSANLAGALVWYNLCSRKGRNTPARPAENE